MAHQLPAPAVQLEHTAGRDTAEGLWLALPYRAFLSNHLIWLILLSKTCRICSTPQDCSLSFCKDHPADPVPWGCCSSPGQFCRQIRLQHIDFAPSQPLAVGFISPSSTGDPCGQQISFKI